MTAGEDFFYDGSDRRSLIEYYLEEMGQVPDLGPGEEALLIERLLEGDRDARKRLTEAKLALAMETAQGYAGRGLTELDLIQEANLLLMQALDEYRGGELDPFLADRIRSGIEALLAEEFDYEGMSMRLADEANRVLEASNDLTAEFGRAPTLEELAAETDMDQERLQEIMKMSLDAVNAQAQEGTDDELFPEGADYDYGEE